MTGELKHVSVATSLTQAEWEDANTHYVDSSAQGDILRLTSSGGIQRLAAGSAGAILVSGGTSGADPSYWSLGATGSLLETSSSGLAWLAVGASTGQVLQVSSGGVPAWSNPANFGIATTWAPTITQSSAITITVNYADYTLMGKMAFVRAKVTIDSAGSASTGIQIAGFPAAIAPRYTTGDALCGHGGYNDAGTRYVLGVVATSSSIMQAFSNSGTTFFGTNPAITVAANDILSLDLSYEVTTG